MPRPEIRPKSIYETPSEEDGYRVLVDRLWPRGIGKSDARLDAWARELSPTDAMRRAFGHDADQWPAFREAYLDYLGDESRRTGMAALLEAAGDGPLTLLYAARETERNNAVVLREALQALA